MGWSAIPGATRDDVVRELLKDYAPLAHELCGDILWCVLDEEVIGHAIIVAYLLGVPGGNGDWGYKDLHEVSHPFYYTCPLRFLDLAPVMCEAWRRTVREYHSSRSPRK